MGLEQEQDFGMSDPASKEEKNIFSQSTETRNVDFFLRDLRAP